MLPLRSGSAQCANGTQSKVNSQSCSKTASQWLNEMRQGTKFCTVSRGSDPDQRRAARQSQSRPLVDVFFTWLPAQAARVSRNSELGEAMAYMLRREEGFRLFLDNGRRLQRFQPGRSQRKKCFSSKLHCGPAPQCIKDIGSRRRFRCIRGATFPQIR